jgi:CRP/FNR family transcriptional regulator, anaerobic regulatory protein
MLNVTPSTGQVALRKELVLGRRALSARFRSAPLRRLGAGEVLTAAACSSNLIYHLVEGWAYQFRDFSDGHQAIVYVYTPGEVIGLDAIFRTRPAETVITLTSIATAVIDAAAGLTDLMTCRSTALYIAWLLGRRQRRSDGLLAAISSLDARGRLATMLLDFYTRLRRQRLTTRSSYNLPLTQVQIGSYLGLTVAHVNRVLRSLRDEQIANLEKHCVTILDLERLTTLTQNGSLATAVAAQRSLDNPTPAWRSVYPNTGNFQPAEMPETSDSPRRVGNLWPRSRNFAPEERL